MKVHLLKAPDQDSEFLEDVLQILEGAPGPLRFQYGQIYPVQLDSEADVHIEPCYSREIFPRLSLEEERELSRKMFSTDSSSAFLSPEEEPTIQSVAKKWLGKKEFTKADKEKVVDTPEDLIDDDVEMPRTEFPKESEIAEWDDLFNYCRLYRRYNDVGDDEHVVLLTTIGNAKNWFAGSDRLARNHFVHTADWDFYLGSTIEGRYPVAYETAITILHKLVSENYGNELRHLVHLEPKGCISDFCGNKKEIILKMRTADICPTCISHLKRSAVPREVVQQVLQIMDNIRSAMTFRSRSDYFNTPSKLEVRGHMCKIFLSELGNLEVRLTPRQRALYIFFLRHPEGVLISHLQDHREEIAELYARMANAGQRSQIESALDNLLEPYSETLGTELSRIRAAFKKASGEGLQEHYIIAGSAGEKKRIALDRSLVKFYCD